MDPIMKTTKHNEPPPSWNKTNTAQLLQSTTLKSLATTTIITTTVAP
jgi:hypothetical protein